MKKVFLSLASIVFFTASLVAAVPSSDEIVDALLARNPHAKEMTTAGREAAKNYLEEIQAVLESMNKLFEDFNTNHPEGYEAIKNLLGTEKLVVMVQPVPSDVRGEESEDDVDDSVLLDEEDYEEEA